MEPTQAPKRTRRKILIVLLTVAAVTILAALIVYGLWNVRVNHQLRDRLAAIRRANEPLTFNDLEARLTPVDEADDATRFYLAGMELMVKQKQESDLFNERGKSDFAPLPAEILAKIKSDLDANKLALDLFDQGSQKEKCHRPLWVQQGLQYCLPKLAHLRQAARLSSLRSHYLAATGQPDQAVDSLITSIRLLRLIEAYPILIEYLVKIACVSLAAGDTAYVLQHSQPTEAALIRLQQNLEPLVTEDDFRQVLLAERVYQIEVMRNLFTEGKDLPETPENAYVLPEKWAGFMSLSPNLKLMAAGLLADVEALLPLASKPWPEGYHKMRAYQPQGQFGQIWIPGYQRLFVMIGRSLAAGRSIQTAVAVERFRRAKGTLPASLDQLVPTFLKAVPDDPFMGKPLTYRRETNAYVIYSFGDNLKDDHGAFMGTGKTVKETDADWGVKITLPKK